MRFFLIFSLVFTLVSGKLPDVVGIDCKSFAGASLYILDGDSTGTDVDALLPQVQLRSVEASELKSHVATRVLLVHDSAVHSPHSPRAPPFTA